MKGSKWLASLVGVLVLSFGTNALGTTTSIVPVPAIPKPRDIGGRSDLDPRAIEEARKMGASDKTIIVARGFIKGKGISRFKLLDPTTGKVFGVSFDKNGNVLSESQAEEAAAAVRNSSLVGKIGKDLLEKIEKASIVEIHLVDVWVEHKGLPTVDRDLDRYDLSLQKYKAALKVLLNERINELAIRKEQVEYVSEYAPLIIIKTTGEEIKRLAKHSKVAMVLRAMRSEEAKLSLNSAASTLNATGMWSAGWTGVGAKVAVWEGGSIKENHDFLGSVTRRVTGTPPTAHATEVAGAIASQDPGGIGNYPTIDKGIGYNVSRPLFSASYEDGSSITGALEWALNQGVHIVNGSLDLGMGKDRSSYEYYLDYVVKSLFKTVTIAAANRGNGGTTSGCNPDTGVNCGYVGNPGMAYNVITVGMFDDNNTGNWTWGDDFWVGISSWNEAPAHNPNGDREKPELVAVGQNVVSTTVVTGCNNCETYVGSGTSIAAPMIAGGSALLMQKASFLTFWPEVVKALIMAGSIHDIPNWPGTNCTSGGFGAVDECDGAGAPEFGTMSKTLDSGYYWYSSAYPGYFPKTYTFNVTTPNDWVRIAFVWDASSNGTNPSVLNADLDMVVQRPNGTIIAWSGSWDNPFEVVEFTADQVGTYTIVISEYRFDAGTNTYWGLAAWRNVSP